MSSPLPGTELRCNNHKCHALLEPLGKAVVTACSHLFCTPCANTLFSAALICPACDSSLTQPDDLVMSCLNPTEDYKATILAGLDPATILQIAARAINFWSYQMSHESAYQTAVLRNTQDRLASADTQLRKVHGELAVANNNIANLESELVQRSAHIKPAVVRNDNHYHRRAVLGSAAQHGLMDSGSFRHANKPMQNGLRPFVPTPRSSSDRNPFYSGTPKDTHNPRMSDQLMDRKFTGSGW